MGTYACLPAADMGISINTADPAIVSMVEAATCWYNLTVHLPSFCQIKIGSSANTSEAAPVNMSDVAESSAKTVQESNSGTIQKEQEQAPHVGGDTGQSKLEALIT